MSVGAPWERVHGYYQRRAAGLLHRRPFVIDTPHPVISFTFDDFPQSALRTGGRILNQFGLAGTYYASLGLTGEDGPTGRIFASQDLARVLEEGHELGCHTFSHCHSWNTPPRDFELSVIENRAALARVVPGAAFRTLSYPISHPRPRTKLRMAQHFLCCRGGGQTINAGTADLNHLSAFFLEKTRGQIDAVKQIIDDNRQARGWLIFATHDVSPTPTPFGCTPEYFERIVRYAVESGARILPLATAFELLRDRELVTG